MGKILSFRDARAEKMKAELGVIAQRRQPCVVESTRGLIAARRIFCREAVAVLVDRYGVQTRLAYGEITDVSPVLPAADIVAQADWQVVVADENARAEATVLRFPAR